jgi:hypothetical protein
MVNVKTARLALNISDEQISNLMKAMIVAGILANHRLVKNFNDPGLAARLAEDQVNRILEEEE